MFNDLEVLRLSMSMARHAGARQAVIAQNVANADTPGYRARDLPSFVDSLERPAMELRASRPGHLTGAGPFAAMLPAPRPADGPGAPNGNTVSLEHEMLRAVEAQRAHNRAVQIYQTSLGVLRSALGRP